MRNWQDRVWSGVLSAAIAVTPLAYGGAAFAQEGATAPAASATTPVAPVPSPGTASVANPAAPAAPEDGEPPAEPVELDDEGEVIQSRTPPPDGSSQKHFGTVVLASGVLLGVIGAGILISKKNKGNSDKNSLVPLLLMGTGALACIPGFALLNAGEAQEMKYQRWKEDQEERSGHQSRLAPGLAWTMTW